MDESLNRKDVTRALINDCSEDLMDVDDFGVHASNSQSRQYMQTNAGYGQHLRTSCGSGSREFQTPDRANEENKDANKKEVDLYFKNLIAGMMPVENLPKGKEGDKESWLEIITAISLEVARLLRPQPPYKSKVRGIDRIKYVKIKCLASGRRSDCTVVKGVVCKKNVAHHRMPSNLEKPRILLLGGALEYQRVSNLWTSFDTLQEMDPSKMAVVKILNYHPDILLVEKSVSRDAEEYLLSKDTTLVQNIERPLLERISRCTGGQIIQLTDQLSSQNLGYCDQFYVKKSLEEHGTTGHAGEKLEKTLMYFDGCPKPLGYTVLLRGANVDELKKAKRLMRWGIHVAYHRSLSYPANRGAFPALLPSDNTSSADWVQNTLDQFLPTFLSLLRDPFHLFVHTDKKIDMYPKMHDMLIYHQTWEENRLALQEDATLLFTKMFLC